MDPLRSYANLNKAFAIAKQTNSFKRNDETVKMDKSHFPPGDPVLIQSIVNHLKARGIFDQFRHECLADVDTKPSYQNLSQRVDGFVSKFLTNETWNPDQNKNEWRNKLRRQIDESGMLSLGVDHVVEQVINPKIYQVFAPKIREVVEQYLGLREIPEENEAKMKKQESTVSETGIKTEKQVSESSDGISTIAKSIVSDPISEILALGDSSKQKKITTSQIKSGGLTPDISAKSEKKNDEKSKVSIELKFESLDQTMESPAVSHFDSKIHLESLKIKKEPKTNECDTSDLAKKNLKIIDLKSETRSSSEDAKLLDQDISFSEDSNSYSGTNKSSDALDFKSDSSVKSKSSDSVKTKIKTSSIQKECSPKNTHALTETRKFRFKESYEVASPTKSPVDKLSKLSLKVSKVPSKDHLTPTKSLSSSSKSSKEEQDIDPQVSSVTKVADAYRKLFSSKTFSVKREVDVTKSKNVSDKLENKTISEHKKFPGDISHPKSKINSPVSSSYDSSQGSDQEKDPLVMTPSKERRKLFSKGSKPENEPKASTKDMDKSSSSSTPTKTDKGRKSDQLEKHADRSKKAIFEKHIKSLKVQESSKIVSRSDSTKSSSSIGSTSDSSKETSYHSTGSEGVDDSSSSKSDLKKKKSLSSSKKSCKETSDEPATPPPPPPPSSSLPTDPLSSSFESESLESEDEESSNESSSGRTPSPVDSADSSSNLSGEKVNRLNKSGKQSKMKEKLLSDVPDVFLESSSEDEFCYFSTPEKIEREEVCDSDVTVSSVHTSDLSSFEDEQSDSSGDENSAKSNFEENFREKLNFNNVENVSPLNLKKRRRNGEKVNSYLQRRTYEL